MAKAPATARAVALDLLGMVLGRRVPLNDALESHRGFEKLDARDRAFARLILTATLRRLGQIDSVLEKALDKPRELKSREVHDILRLGTCQLLFLGTPPHAAVDGAVRLAEARRHAPFKALVNAVLRRIAAQGEHWAAQQDEERVNTPDWLWDAWEAAFGPERTRAIARAHLAEPPLDLTCKEDAQVWAARLGAKPLPTGSLRLSGAGAIAELPGYGEGAWWVQDAAAALPAPLLGRVSGRRVIDLCAAPGGKTAQLAAAGARVTAVDLSEKRLARLEENLARLHLSAEVVRADALSWRPEAPAEAVLLDAPCTATGTIRRNPDVPWLRRPQDVGRMVALQERLMRAAVEMLAPGGLLVYSVCSLQAQECEAPVEALLSAGVPLKRRPLTTSEIQGLGDCVSGAGDLRTLPCHFAALGGMDGFYAARLQRLG